MKKLLAIILVIIFILSLAACGKNNKSETATELFEKIFSRINRINCHSGTSPP